MARGRPRPAGAGPDRAPARLPATAWRAAAFTLATLAAVLDHSSTAAVRIFGADGLVLASIDVPDGFALGYVHSINLSPVDEWFRVERGILVLDRVVFDQLSTGMPSGGEDGFSVEDGRFVTRPNRRFARVDLRVSPVPGHAMRVADRRIPLTRWAPVGGLLSLSAVQPDAPAGITVSQEDTP